MTCGIYKLISPNNKIYVGQSINIEKRWIDHKRRAKKKSTRHSFKLYNSVRKYGWENFIKEIAEICTPERLNDREIYYIDLCDSLNSGLNGRSGGNSNWKTTQDTKNKLRSCNLGKYNGDQNIEFYIDNIKYKSIGEAAKLLNIPPKTIHNRLNSRNEKFSNYIYVDSSLVPIRNKVNNNRNRKIEVIYNSIIDAIDMTKISKSTIFYRLKRGTYKYVD
jgi:DNA-directed RNA polymerase specialized sigma24 family protein